MVKVLCHNCCPSLPEGMITIESDVDLSDDQYDFYIDHHTKYCIGDDMTYDNFHEFLLTLHKEMQDRNFAEDIYGALCNMRWQNKKDPSNIYHCSWRYAGGLVATIRGQGEDYLDFYCNGNEGKVSKEVNKLFNKAGWKQLPYEDELI